MTAPRRIWIDWKRANDGFVAYDEAPNSPYSDCHDEYFSAALFNLVEAERDALRAQLATAEAEIATAKMHHAQAFSAGYESGEADALERAAIKADEMEAFTRRLAAKDINGPEVGNIVAAACAAIASGIRALKGESA